MSITDLSLSDTYRFWSHVDTQSGAPCWLWKLKLDRKGYGTFTSGSRRFKAHRVSVSLSGRAVPADMYVDHICRNPQCVNPSHLRVVTPRQNTLENSRSISAINAAKTHCKRGHPLSGHNLGIGHTGKRFCRTCNDVARGIAPDAPRLNDIDGVRLCKRGHRVIGDNARMQAGRARCVICLRAKLKREAVARSRRTASSLPPAPVSA